MLIKRLHKEISISEPSSERTKAPKSADIRAALEKKLARRVNSSAVEEEEKLSPSQKACIQLFSQFDTALSLNKRRTANLDGVLRAAQSGFRKQLTLHEFRKIWKLVPNFYSVVPCSSTFVIQATPTGTAAVTLEKRLQGFTLIVKEM